MVEREITPTLVRLFSEYPFVTVTGPRQGGKTTLCRAAFPSLEYVNLESAEPRTLARNDPGRFLSLLPDGAILDGIQRAFGLTSKLPVSGNEKRENGLFLLVGSQNFALTHATNQPPAGRTATLQLLPFSLAERVQTGAGNSVEEILFSGFYPRIHDQGLDPYEALGFYLETHVERHVRQLTTIQNLTAFQTFLGLCAGCVGRLTNFAALAADTGITQPTARSWFSLLEADYTAFRLPPFFANIRKRLIRSRKLYFYDVGLAAHLIGIQSADQLVTHPLRGALFENMVVVETLKHYANSGRRPRLSFYRQRSGLECDLLIETDSGIHAIEIKSGFTVASDAFASLDAVESTVPNVLSKTVIHGGTDREDRTAGTVAPFTDLRDILDTLDPAPGSPK